MTNLKAVCVLKSESGVSGVVHFDQDPSGDETVKITGQVKGLTPGKHGFHIHEYGDNTNGCISAGAHFNVNPKMHHGGPDSEIRHNGDLGNVTANEQGIADINIEGKNISLKSGHQLDIKGRSLVLHEKVDDLGKGENEESLKTGNAGARVACGIIGIAKSS